MGICMSAESRVERQKSNQIDRVLEEDSKKLRRECKILLLGTSRFKSLKQIWHTRIYQLDNNLSEGSGESGKSTIVKQMKIIHQNGFSKEELLTWKLVIYKNIVESIQSIVSAMKTFNYEFETVKDQVRPSPLPHLITFIINSPIK